MDYPKKRNLDGVYFRVYRCGKYENVCFTDLTELERQKFIEGRPASWYRGLAIHLADCLRRVGDERNVVYKEVSE